MIFIFLLFFSLLVPKDSNDFDRFISLSFAKLGVIDYKSPDIVAEAVSVQAALEVDAIANSCRQGVVDCSIILNYFLKNFQHFFTNHLFENFDFDRLGDLVRL